MTLDNMTGITEGSYTGFCKSQLITCNRVKECNGVCPFEDALKRADKTQTMNEQHTVDHDKDWIIGCIKHDGFIKTDRFDKANQIIIDAPSAEAETVDCTDFIRWLTETVMDDGMWELNAVAYGEVIARKLTKLGVLEVKDDVYIYEPSAEAVQGWIPVEEQPPEFPCLICDANGNQPSVPLGIVTITDEEHGEWHIDGRLWDSPKVFVDGEWGSQLGYGNRIIAWMPLPEPYREDGEV